MLMTAFEVFLKGRHINTVYYLEGMSSMQVKQSLIEHDGYRRDITVSKRLP